MNDYYQYPMGHHYIIAGWGGLFLGIIFIVIIASIARRLIWGHGWRHDRWRRWQEMRGSSAIEILKERYAKGEINKEEYEQKKKDILEQ